MASAPVEPGSGNRMLDRLPARERRVLADQTERVELAGGDVLCAAGAALRHVYFPRRGVVSLFAGVVDRPPVGVGWVGIDGMVGVSAATTLGAMSTFHAVAQVPGRGDRLAVPALRRLLPQCPALQAALFAYACATTAQMAQNVACVALHGSHRRVARWMLDVTDGLHPDAFWSTQAAIAEALGLQRPAVSRVAAELQRAGLIRTRRGDVTIVDRRGLWAMACRCSMETPGGSPPPLRRTTPTA